VVASLHDVDVAAKVSDQVALIRGGGLSAWGAPEAVLNSRTVAELYDFNGAEFSTHLGGIELRGDGSRGRAFVVAGMGSGAQVYRMLAKRGFSIATGVLHTNDLDYYVARSLGAECTAQSPMEAVNGAALEEAAQQLDGCDVVIDCGFEVGTMNLGNLDLLRRALRQGKPVFSLRPGDMEALTQVDIHGQLVSSGDAAQLIENLDRRVPINGSTRHLPKRPEET
jgi:iron complex transport system ATP-binding protein